MCEPGGCACQLLKRGVDDCDGAGDGCNDADRSDDRDQTSDVCLWSSFSAASLSHPPVAAAAAAAATASSRMKQRLHAETCDPSYKISYDILTVISR